MTNNIASKSKAETIDLLYGQLMKVLISHPIMAAIVSLWFFNIAPVIELILWASCICFLAAFRFTLNIFYQTNKEASNSARWLHIWVALSFVQASCYSIGFIYFVPLTNPTYIVAVGLFIAVISGASIIGTLSSRYAMAASIIPLLIPNAVYFGLYGGQFGSLVALTLILFSIVVLTLGIRLNRAFAKSMALNHQHKIEIEKRKQIEHQLQLISRKDGLTNLYNRRYFDEVLNTEIGRAQRNHSPLCLLMIDIDYFKNYNDQYGHVAGDECLINIADIISNLASRKGDLIARYGGEEFGIILPNIDLQGAVSFANKIQQSVKAANIEHISTQLSSLKCVTVSVGVTNLQPFRRMTTTQLIDVADRALYKAKQDGRNRVHFIDNIGVHEQ